MSMGRSYEAKEAISLYQKVGPGSRQDADRPIQL